MLQEGLMLLQKMFQTVLLSLNLPQVSYPEAIAIFTNNELNFELNGNRNEK